MKQQEKPASSRVPAPAKAEARSRLTNGRQTFLERVDGRSLQARRWRDLYREFLSETGGKNEALVRTLASLCLQRDLIDVRLAKGEEVDTQDLIRVCGAISRLMSKLGIIIDEPAAADPVLPPDAPPWRLGRRESAELAE